MYSMTVRTCRAVQGMKDVYGPGLGLFPSPSPEVSKICDFFFFLKLFPT